MNYNLFDCFPPGDIHDLGNPIAGPNIRRAIAAGQRIVYEGTRPPGMDGLAGVLIDEWPDVLPWRLDLYNHSPTGFEWGCSGSGPRQLALAILAHATEDDTYAVAKHWEFAREIASA